MPIIVTCSHCRKALTAPDALLGKRGLCPYCQKPISVEPAREPSHVQAPPPRPAAPRAEEASGLPPPSPEEAPVHAQRATPDLPPGTPEGVVLRVGTLPGRLGLLARVFFRQTNPTDAGLLATGAIATVLTALSYLILFRPLRGTYFGDLFADRGWVPYPTVWMFFWAFAILGVKLWKLTAQQASLSQDPLPGTTRINPQTAGVHHDFLRKTTRRARRNFLLNRILLALEQLRAHKSVQHIASTLDAQAEIDGCLVESSYTMLKVFIWAIPILGFIGTVIGISDAVFGFNGAVKTAEDLEKIKTALGDVTRGLAVAFDTTLLALIFSVVIMFPANSLQKAEEELLSSVDSYCNENLLPRLEEDHPRDAEAAEDLSRRLGEVESALAKSWRALQEQLEENRRQQAELFRELLNRNAANGA
jgi:biopolymer transport protein ExbB/TolQ